MRQVGRATAGGTVVGRAVVGVAATGALLLAGCSGGGDDGDDPPGPPSPTGPPPSLATLPGHHELTYDWQGEERLVLLDEPVDRDPEQELPLIVALHGSPGTPQQVRTASRLEELVQAEEVVVAYPQGADRRWRPIGRLDNDDDVGFLRMVVEELVEEFNVAPGQVYAAGLSNGASMMYRLGAEAADTFAAVAPVSGVFQEPPESLSPDEPVSVIGFVGLNDGEVVDADSLGTWRDLLGCEAGEPEPVDDEERVTRIDATCPDGSEVVEYRIGNTGHVWPNVASHGLAANQAMWEVFAASSRA